MGTDYEEIAGSPDEEGTVTRFTAKMEVLCAWADRYDVIAAFLAGSVGGGPIIYPHRPTTGAYAQRAAAQGFGQAINDSGIGTVGQTFLQYEKARVTIEFGTYAGGPEQNGTDLISETLDPWVENIPLQVRLGDGSPAFTWTNAAGDPLTDEEAPVRQTRGCIYTFKRYNITSIPAAAFSLLGKVNASSVTSVLLGKTFEAETLLFTPPKLERTGGTAGAWSAQYALNYRPNFDNGGVARGWNYFWRSKTGDYAQIWNVTTAAVQKIYPTGNFTLI